MPSYLPAADRIPDPQYKKLLESCIGSGISVPTKQGPPAYTVIAPQMRFVLANGFPLITDRDITFYKASIGELCAFINGARTLAELEAFGCKWWDPWATAEKCEARGLEPGDLGPGSYGHAYHNFTTSLNPDDEGFDQLPHTIRKLRDLPEDRTALVTTWNPPFNHREAGIRSSNTIAPCHGTILQFRVLNGQLYMIHYQRSGDVPVGVATNLVQYAALGLMMEHLTGYPLKEYVHIIGDAHVYGNQKEHVLELIKREPRSLPTVTLTEEAQAITDIHDFRGEHFEVSDYHPYPAMADIPVST